MANEIVQEVPIKRSISAATSCALLALLIAIVALILVFRANHRTNVLQHQVNSLTYKLNTLETRVNSSLGNQAAPTSSGAGIGPNTSQAVPSSNAMPNGNGQ